MTITPRQREILLTVARADSQKVDRAFANPCLYCGVDDAETPYEDTEEHQRTSQHGWAVYNS